MSILGVGGKLGGSAVKSTLSREEWEVFEAGAEKMGRALVGSLKSIMGEVQHVLDSKGQQGKGDNRDHQPQARSDEDSSFSFDKRKVDYDDFVRKMRDKKAWQLRNQLQQFCRKFMEGPRHSRDDARDMVQAEIEMLEDAMKQHPLWTGLSDEELEGAFESLERYVISRLHTRIFAPDLEARKQDAQLRMRIAKLHFITPDHLDIAASNRHPEAWSKAIGCLQAMSEKVTPLEKIDSILEASKHIYGACLLNKEHKPMSADEYLPALVYLIIQANPPELQSNVDFISSYRSRARMIGEGAYFFTHLAGAVYFIETLDASRLSIEPELFEKLMADEDENIYSFVSSAGTAKRTSLEDPGSSGQHEAAADGQEKGAEQTPIRTDPLGKGPASFQQFSERSGLFNTPHRGDAVFCPPTSRHEALKAAVNARRSPSKEAEQENKAEQKNVEVPESAEASSSQHITVASDSAVEWLFKGYEESSSRTASVGKPKTPKTPQPDGGSQSEHAGTLAYALGAPGVVQGGTPPKQSSSTETAGRVIHAVPVEIPHDDTYVPPGGTGDYTTRRPKHQPKIEAKLLEEDDDVVLVSQHRPDGPDTNQSSATPAQSREGPSLPNSLVGFCERPTSGPLGGHTSGNGSSPGIQKLFGDDVLSSETNDDWSFGHRSKNGSDHRVSVLFSDEGSSRKDHSQLFDDGNLFGDETFSRKESASKVAQRRSAGGSESKADAEQANRRKTLSELGLLDDPESSDSRKSGSRKSTDLFGEDGEGLGWLASNPSSGLF